MSILAQFLDHLTAWLDAYWWASTQHHLLLISQRDGKLIGGGKGLPLVASARKAGRKDKVEHGIMARMNEHHWQSLD